MTTGYEVRGQQPRLMTGEPLSVDGPLTLAEEHGLLLRQVAAQAEELLSVTASGGWPTRELVTLVTYLRVEVLRHAADEERLLFPSCAPSADLDRLGRDHSMLHLMTEALAQAAEGDGPPIPADLTAAIQDLLAHLERHLGNEEAVLAANGAHGDTRVTRRPVTTQPDRRTL